MSTRESAEMRRELLNMEFLKLVQVHVLVLVDIKSMMKEKL
jgi:hypothetical protein